MVGRLTLDQVVKVRVLAPQPLESPAQAGFLSLGLHGSRLVKKRVPTPLKASRASSLRDVRTPRISLIAAAVALTILSLPASAFAVAPQLTSVSQQSRHPAITFAAPRADNVTVYIASKPDRATDGEFLHENVVDLDTLIDSEIQTGRWLDESQIDPGRYWLMIRAYPDFDSCYQSGGGYDPACAQGFSDLAPLAVPKPAAKYAASVTVYKYIREASLTLRATPLGEKRPYQVCFSLRTKKRRCVRGTLSGSSWNASATDSVSVKTAPLPSQAQFKWYVGDKLVASKRARVR
jgi:hypothetical protein